MSIWQGFYFLGIANVNLAGVLFFRDCKCQLSAMSLWTTQA